LDQTAGTSGRRYLRRRASAAATFRFGLPGRSLEIAPGITGSWVGGVLGGVVVV